MSIGKSKMMALGILGGEKRSTLLDGLVSVWKMDEESNGSVQVPRLDSYGTNHLTDNGKAVSIASPHNLAVVTTPTGGKFLYCLSNSSLQTGDIEFTIAARVYTTTLSGTQVVTAKGESTDTASIEYGLVLSGSKFSLNAWNSGVQIITANTFGTISINTWYDVIAWVDKTQNKYFIEVNGVSDSSARSKIISPSNALLGVGGYGNGASILSGRLDDVAFWKKKLTDTERQEWRTSGVPFDSSGVAQQNYTLTELTIGGQSAEYLVPTAAQSGTLVIYHHGSGENQTAWRVDVLKPDLREALLGAGHILAASAAHGNNWGNQASINDYIALYSDAISRFSISKVIFISQSMGGLSGLSLVALGTVPVDGWLGIFPACNLASCYANPSFTDAIKLAYSIASDGSDYATKTNGFDPVLLDDSTFDLPMRFYASADDVTVTKTDNSDAMATLVNGYATENTVVVCSGAHGDPSHFQPSDVLAFISRC